MPNRQIMVTKEPVGVAALITPWNFPAAMITRKLGPCLAAGCGAVIKPAEDTPLTALALLELGHRAGLPHGLVSVITTPRELASGVGETLCKHPKISKLSFTGSTPVGVTLARWCAEGMKRTSLELGGNAPFIVFDDADVEVCVCCCCFFFYSPPTCGFYNSLMRTSHTHNTF
jgi:acyl-CoA reductase-like NAD-dependent aldehyde dehydrogenase